MNHFFFDLDLASMAHLNSLQELWRQFACTIIVIWNIRSLYSRCVYTIF